MNIGWSRIPPQLRSEEHTSELQSQSNLVCRLLLEKKKLEKYVQHTPEEADQADDDFRWQKAFLVGGASIENYHPSRNNWGPLVVPANDYFVLGDNRDNSSDSRYWGFVADSLVRGQPIVVYYSYAPDTGDRLDWLTRLRWKRFGEIVH